MMERKKITTKGWTQLVLVLLACKLKKAEAQTIFMAIPLIHVKRHRNRYEFNNK